MSERRWAEITVSTESAWVEPVSAALIAIGAGGVEILGFDPGEAEGDWAAPVHTRPPAGVRAYLPADDLLGERLQLLRARLADAATEWPGARTEIHIRPAAETDWAAAWKEHYHTVRIGRVAIVPSWEEYRPESGELVVRMDPGMAFGAGGHPTTRQSLLLLQELLAQGQSVLDIGTGSGILAAAAAQLGAGRVLARDIDPQAVEVAGENIARNGLAALVAVERGDLSAGLTGRYDLILANLIADLHLRLMPALPARLAPAGRAVLAGIIAGRAGEVRDAAAAAGLRVLKELREGEWVALVLTHNPNTESLVRTSPGIHAALSYKERARTTDVFTRCSPLPAGEGAGGEVGPGLSQHL